MFTEVPSTFDYSWGERALVLGGLCDGVRADGRSFFDYRPVRVETGVLQNAYGSSRVRLGLAEIICSVKGELRRCDSRHPDRGAVQFFARFSPVAGRKYLGSSAGEPICDVIIATLNQAYGAPGVFDFRKLCVKPDSHYWLLHVDLVVIS